MSKPDKPAGNLAVVLRDAQRFVKNPDEADIGWFEGLFKAAAERAARNGVPRDEFDPLLRLVRSYLRGSYRDAPPGDIAWALAAVTMVGRGAVDPRRVLRVPGFRPDERTVRWVRRHIADTMRAYLAWERTIGETPLAMSSPSEPAPLTSLDVRVLERMDPTLFGTSAPTRTSGGAPVAVGPILEGAAGLRRALQAGDVIRVFGPPQVLEGLKNGGLEMIRSGPGNLGVVRDVATKDFAGHLRLGEVEFSGVAAPALAAFQVVSAVTLQYYLARIDRQLGEISRDLEAVRSDTRDDRYGRIETARSKCASVERVLTITGRVGEQDALRLELAVNDLEQTYQALRSNAEKFCARVEAADIATVGKDDLEALLKDGAGPQLTDTRLLLYAAVVRHRIQGVQVSMHVVDGEERVALAINEERAEHQEMLELLHRLQAAFRKLNLPKSEMDRRWPNLGGPEKALVNYCASSRGVREQLAMPASTLPALMPAEPFVLDLRLAANNSIEAEWAHVRPASAVATASDDSSGAIRIKIGQPS
jgi:hypothetical protein